MRSCYRPGLPLLAIAGALCWYCDTEASENKPLKKCAGCLRASYCGSECQKYDLKMSHKVQCPTLQMTNDCRVDCQGVRLAGDMTWENYAAMQVTSPISSLNDRSDEYQHHRMFHARDSMSSHKEDADYNTIIKVFEQQPRCDHCYLTSFDAQDSSSVFLTPCKSLQGHLLVFRKLSRDGFGRSYQSLQKVEGDRLARSHSLYVGQGKQQSVHDYEGKNRAFLHSTDQVQLMVRLLSSFPPILLAIAAPVDIFGSCYARHTGEDVEGCRACLKSCVDGDDPPRRIGTHSSRYGSEDIAYHPRRRCASGRNPITIHEREYFTPLS